MPKILLDTKAVWGLIVRNSVYADHVYELAKEYELILPLPAIIEVIMAIYKIFSNQGENIENGLEAVIQAIDKLRHILKNQIEYGIRVRILIPDYATIFGAVDLIKKYREIFVKIGPKKTKWLRIFDAIIAAIWIKRKVILLADDPVFERISQKYDLEYIKLEKRSSKL